VTKDVAVQEMPSFWRMKKRGKALFRQTVAVKRLLISESAFDSLLKKMIEMARGDECSKLVNAIISHG
jgi:hypothetical protein